MDMTTETGPHGLPRGAEDWPPPDAVDWRRRQLITAGFDQDLAARCSADPAVDLHEVLSLVDRGCEPRVAGLLALSVESSG